MNIKFCIECAAPLRRLTNTDYVCANKHHFYNSPTATVAVVFARGAEVLFSKRAINPNKGKYDFPGGFLEYNESAVAACIRETKEETGVVIEPSSLHLLTTYNEEYLPNISVIDLIFVTTAWSGEFTASDDSASLEWKPISFISTPEFVPFYRGLDKLLQEYLERKSL